MLNAVQPGETILHYRILQKVGTGGMGEVYRAEDLKLHRTVAIKVISGAAHTCEKSRRRLLNEARSASALNHPNIVTIHAIEQTVAADTPVDFIVMEYVDGCSLSEQIRQGPLDIPLVADIGIQAAYALAAAHEAGIVHRDIKPSNIAITPRGQVKVLDFGLAKAVPVLDLPHADEGQSTSLESLTSKGIVVGTVAYMSPEQTRGEPLDARSDIFSLGCVLYEAATGIRPFRGSSVLGIWHQIAEANPAPPSSVRPDLPREFDLILERALAKDKVRRYSSAGEFSQALRQFADRHPLIPATDQGSDLETFVGREPELKRLTELMRQALEGRGRIVFLTGEPGIGKTSLAGQFLRAVRRLSPLSLVTRGSCIEQYGTGEAYLPFLDALGTLLTGPEREGVLSALRSYAPTWCLQLPTSFISTGELERVQREAIGATKERMLREMGDFLGALTSSTPLVLLLEDLHWADPSSADLVRHLSHRAAGQRLLLVGTLRPEGLEVARHPFRKYIGEMQAHGLCEEISLQPLDCRQVATYLDVRFAPNDFPPELATLIQRKTEGNPLFVASLAQFLMEHGDIIRPHGPWTLARPVVEMELEVPTGVRSMIQKKIEVLETMERRSLEYASIEGEEFSSTVVAALLGISDVALEEQLDRLDKVHRLIQTIGEEELPDGSLSTRYRFAHALYQNILYENLVPKRRVLLHRQAGEELVKHYAGQTLPIAAQLATHFERGRDFVNAVKYLMQMAENASHRYDNSIAVSHCNHALSLTERLPLPERGPGRLELYQKRGNAHMCLGQLKEGSGDFTLMLDEARELNDGKAECAALNALANSLAYSHSLIEMRARTAEAMDAVERIGDQALKSEAMSNLAWLRQFTGELTHVGTLFDQAISLARSCDHGPALLPALTYRGLNHFFRTEYEQAETLHREAYGLASRLHDGLHLCTSLFFLGLGLANQGRISEAIATLEQALEMAGRNGNQVILSRVPNGLGWIYRELGDLRVGVERDRAALEIARQNHNSEAEANSLINLVYDYTGAGDPDAAKRALRDVEPLFDQDPWMRWRFFDIRVHAGAAEFWLAQRNLDLAHEHATTLLTNATRYVVPKYVAVAHKVLGEIAAASGERDTAMTRFQAALDALVDHAVPLVTWKI